MFYQVFLSPQVKPCAFITYKHGIYELPNDLTFRISSNDSLVPSLPSKMKKKLMLAKNFRKTAIKLFP